MNTDNREQRASLQKHDDIDARLTRIERSSQITLTMVIVVGAATLFLLGFLLARA
jgi:hypothetical protein